MMIVFGHLAGVCLRAAMVEQLLGNDACKAHCNKAAPPAAPPQKEAKADEAPQKRASVVNTDWQELYDDETSAKYWYRQAASENGSPRIRSAETRSRRRRGRRADRPRGRRADEAREVNG